MRLASVAGFTNLGYRWHSRKFEAIESDLTGQTVVITGATGGLGLATAQIVAKLGARTIIVGRSAEKLDAAQREVAGEVVAYEADLSLMTEIRSFAARLLENEERIDVLVNNVGVLLPQRQITPEGIERTLAVDLAGHFLLTKLVANRLVDSSPSRIINITSGGMYSEKIRPDDLQSAKGEYKGAAAYARAKRGQVILTRMWAERFKGTGVTVHAMHPGWAKTSGVANSLPTFDRVMKPFLRTPEQGADTIVWLTADAEPAKTNGLLWFDRSPVSPHIADRTRETEEDREALWTGLVDLTGVDFPSQIGTKSQ